MSLLRISAESAPDCKAVRPLPMAMGFAARSPDRGESLTRRVPRRCLAPGLLAFGIASPWRCRSGGIAAEPDIPERRLCGYGCFGERDHTPLIPSRHARRRELP